MQFSFVIPIVHPNGASVGDYAQVELVLRSTLESLTAQDTSHSSVVVVCHRLPVWASDFLGRVHFLVIGDDDRFPIDHSVYLIDKALKSAIGSLFAIDHLGATHIMMTDGDDYARSDLARLFLDNEVPPAGKDGYVITKGYNVNVAMSEQRLALGPALEVGQFNRTCGSCRIFLRDALNDRLARIVPRVAALRQDIPPEAPVTLSASIINAFFEDARNAFNDGEDPIRVFARHVRLKPEIDLATVPIPLMAKGCGHGNHVGFRQGDVHWHMVKGELDIHQFLQDFGFAGSHIVSPAQKRPTSLEMTLRPRFAKAYESIRRRSRAVRLRLTG